MVDDTRMRPRSTTFSVGGVHLAIADGIRCLRVDASTDWPNAKKQSQLITTLENKNKTYQHILQCLQYREKLMNAVIEKDRAGRGGQSSNSKSKVSGVFSSVKV